MTTRHLHALSPRAPALRNDDPFATGGLTQEIVRVAPMTTELLTIWIRRATPALNVHGLGTSTDGSHHAGWETINVRVGTATETRNHVR
ncbi:hypothetical protein [Streptomyces sp. NPDC001508]|uniref:hypothetical protein n=1 Tax=Streptomyces sp. NPDC001508 TaxID=3154656 RepID=UPI003319DFD9